MKRTFLLSLAFLLSTAANASVVDHFKCSIQAIRADQTPIFGTTVDAFAVRRGMHLSPFHNVTDPTPGTQPPDVPSPPQSGGTNWVSFSEIQIKTEGTPGNQASLTLRYQYAGREGTDGTLLEAKQALCMGLSASIGGVATATLCAVPSPDPFAPDARGWDPVDIVDGNPVFNVQALRPRTVPFPDGSKVLFNCEHLGTER